jgi:hypothetical protein
VLQNLKIFLFNQSLNSTLKGIIMIQTFINLFIRPRSVGISQVIEATTFKSALGLYTLTWVLLRLVLGDIGVDALHIAPFINDVEILSYFSTIVIFGIDYIYLLLRLIIAVVLLWILYRFWCTISLKKLIIISLYFMGLCYLFASIKLNLQSYFFSLDYLDDGNWSFLIWNVVGLLWNIVIFYTCILHFMTLYRLTNINKFIFLVITMIIFILYSTLEITITF